MNKHIVKHIGNDQPTNQPTNQPSIHPSNQPTNHPTIYPTNLPLKLPTNLQTVQVDLPTLIPVKGLSHKGYRETHHSESISAVDRKGLWTGTGRLLESCSRMFSACRETSTGGVAGVPCCAFRPCPYLSTAWDPVQLDSNCKLLTKKHRQASCLRNSKISQFNAHKARHPPHTRR